jgi:hypothetical protein
MIKMKLKSVFALGLIATAFFGTSAYANGNGNCWLSVSQSYVPLGQSFNFDITLGNQILPGPLPPNRPASLPPFTIVFYGTKDGVEDIPQGFQHPSMAGFGQSSLTGYGNPPSGGFGGTYLRFAVVYNSDGEIHCTTNTVATVLE